MLLFRLTERSSLLGNFSIRFAVILMDWANYIIFEVSCGYICHEVQDLWWLSSLIQLVCGVALFHLECAVCNYGIEWGFQVEKRICPPNSNSQFQVGTRVFSWDQASWQGSAVIFFSFGEKGSLQAIILPERFVCF